MAIVKGRYTRNVERAKALSRYIAHRAGKDGEKMSRDLFGFDGPMEKEQVYRMLDGAGKGTYFYRMVFSNDPIFEDTFKDLNLWELTTMMMVFLEAHLKRQNRLKGDLQFVAAEHNDHTPIRHVHALVLLEGKLTVEDFTALREAFTAVSLERRQQLDQERLGLGLTQQPDPRLLVSQAPDPKPMQQLPDRKAPATAYASADRWERGLKPAWKPAGIPCPACGPRQPMLPLTDSVSRCLGCGLVLAQG